MQGLGNLGNADTPAPTKRAGQAANPGINAGEAARGGKSRAAPEPSRAAGKTAPWQALPALGTTTAGWSQAVDGVATVPSVRQGCGEGAGCAPYTAIVGVPLAQSTGAAATSTSPVLSAVSSSAK